MKTLSLALLGAGRMGGTHARIIASLGGVRIAAVCDPHLESATTLAAPFGAQATTDLEAVLADPAIDGVIITTPTPTHADLIEAAAGVGKAIFVEKPVADTLEAAERAVNAVKRAGVPCQVGFQRRYDPAYMEAKRKIEAGELGKLEGFRAVGRDPAPPPLAFLKTSGGLLVDMGIHDLDSARFFLGEVSEVYSIGSTLSQPDLAEHGLFDSAVATLRFASGALGTLEVALRTAYGYDIRTEILGERGRLHIEMDNRYHLKQYSEAGMQHDRPRNFEGRFREAYANEIRAFVQNVITGSPVSPTPEDALESLRLALAAQHALETGSVIHVQTFGKREVKT